jgi:hypothetical protein
MSDPTPTLGPWLYVAGPYAHPDPVLNTHRTIRVATAIREHTEYVPFVPHLTMLWHAVTPRPVEWWYAIDLEHLSRCDFLLRLPGESSGADREMAFAAKRGIGLLWLADMARPVIEAWGMK